ncbi:hypothetical protein RRG08_012745, partial [Elysia crispata]
MEEGTKEEKPQGKATVTIGRYLVTFSSSIRRISPGRIAFRDGRRGGTICNTGSRRKERGCYLLGGSRSRSGSDQIEAQGGVFSYTAYEGRRSRPNDALMHQGDNELKAELKGQGYD